MASDEGLAQVAHSVRRSSALYMAVITSPEGTPDEVLFRRADTYAQWIRGKAGKPGADEEWIGRALWEE